MPLINLFALQRIITPLLILEYFSNSQVNMFKITAVVSFFLLAAAAVTNANGVEKGSSGKPALLRTAPRDLQVKKDRDRDRDRDKEPNLRLQAKLRRDPRFV